METIIKQKLQKAQLLKNIAIGLTILCIVSCPIFIAVESRNDVCSDLFGLLTIASFLGGIFSWIRYIEVYFPLKRSMKIIDGDLEYNLQGVNEKVLLTKSAVYCGTNALVVKKTGVVIPYKEILWLYKQVIKAYGVVAECNVIICTSQNKNFSIKMNDQELMWFLENYQQKLPTNFILGYGEPQRRRYFELIKK